VSIVLRKEALVMSTNDEITEKNLINRKMFRKIGEKWTLVAAKCQACGDMSMFQKLTCPKCLQENQTKPFPLSGKGTIYSYTVSYVMPPGFPAPVAMAYVNLVEGPRLFSILADFEPFDKKLKIGAEVEMVVRKFKKDAEGNDLYCYMFRPLSRA
jgi:uncharacterized OB-fold protein